MARDWSGLWFDIAQRYHGEFVGIRFGHLRPGAAQPEWEFISHVECDGVGGFAKLLRSRGYEQATRHLPGLKVSKAPGVFERLKLVRRFMRTKSGLAARWLALGDSNSLEGESRKSLGMSTDPAWLRVNEQETARLERVAKKLGVSLNTLLLSTLGQVTKNKVGQGPQLWMMPVNMRKGVRLATDTQNYASYLVVDPAREDTPQKLHERIRAGLADKEHWGCWIALNSGRWIGYEKMKRTYEADKKTRSYVGAFSNLGQWETAGKGTWFFCPPALQVCPLGVGAVCCGGVLTLTLQTHASLSAAASAILNEWITRLERVCLEVDGELEAQVLPALTE